MRRLVFAVGLLASWPAHSETYFGYFPCWVKPGEICAAIGHTVTVGELSGNGYYFSWWMGITDPVCQEYRAWAEAAGPGGICF